LLRENVDLPLVVSELQRQNEGLRGDITSLHNTVNTLTIIQNNDTSQMQTTLLQLQQEMEELRQMNIYLKPQTYTITSILKYESTISQLNITIEELKKQITNSSGENNEQIIILTNQNSELNVKIEQLNVLGSNVKHTIHF
jgi:SMC interacting uncharacterized protein involved in chromosome segregation